MFNSYFIYLGNLIYNNYIYSNKKQDIVVFRKKTYLIDTFENKNYFFLTKAKYSFFSFFRKNFYLLKPKKIFFFGQGFLLKKNNRSCIWDHFYSKSINSMSLRYNNIRDITDEASLNFFIYHTSLMLFLKKNEKPIKNFTPLFFFKLKGFFFFNILGFYFSKIQFFLKNYLGKNFIFFLKFFNINNFHNLFKKKKSIKKLKLKLIIGKSKKNIMYGKTSIFY